MEIVETTIYHECLSVGSNQNGQQMNMDFPENNVLSLTTISRLKSEQILVKNIVSGAGGSSYILTENGNLFVAGSNKYDELGITNQLILEYIMYHWYKLKIIPQDIAILIIQFTPPNKILYLSSPILMNKSFRFQYKIKYISNGISSHHKFILTQTNELYAIGCNDYDQLGLENINENEDLSLLSFLKVNYFSNENIQITKIECANSYSMFLTDTGDLFCCGYSRSGGTGMINNVSTSAICKIKTISDKIKDVSCGYDHTLCINSKNKVLSFGKNDFGQCGYNIPRKSYRYSLQETAVFKPKLIDYFDVLDIDIQSICCGNSHSLCLDVDGNIYSFGCNVMCQVGLGIDKHDFKKREMYYEPQIINSLQNEIIVSVKCGYNHNVAKTKNCDFYLWGDNRYNQCLIDMYDELEYVETPTKYVSKQYKVKVISIYPCYAETRVILLCISLN